METLLETEEILRQHINWHLPQDEFEGIVRLIRRQRKGNPEAGASHIFVAVPNKYWLAAVKERLVAARITPVPAKQVIAGADEHTMTIDFGGPVTIGSYGQIAAVAPNHLFALGLVEGFFPLGTEDEATLAAERKALAAAIESVPGSIVLSSFRRVEEGAAAKYGLSGRPRREHGVQVLAIAPSRFIEEMDDEAPSMVSGEQYMTNLF